MRLNQFRVRKFRNIIDSGDISVDDLVTCLVGMNESGKTTVLSALHRLNPIDGLSFEVQRDYPRWLLIKDRRENKIDETVVVQATFTLDDAEKAAVDEVLGKDVVTATTVTLERRYGSASPQWRFAYSTSKGVENLLAGVNIRKKTLSQFTDVNDLPEIEAVCVALLADGEDTQAEVTAEEVTRIRAAVKALPGDTIGMVAMGLLTPRLPRFFYFAEYSLLRGRINVEDLKASAEETASSSDQTARSLLALADTTPGALSEDDYEDRKAELEAVGHDLTSQVFEYWKQNPHLRVQFDIDRQIEVQANQHPRVVRTYLDIRVEDTRHAFTNNFDQRSSGFRWFFSFLAAFTEFESRNDNFVVLLDEPGLTLHGRAQADFIRFINERLATAVQVIYTTHSPFMIETNRLERVRIVEDGGPETGATVTQEALEVGDNSLFPLQAALGYDVAQHLFIGETNLLVEGPSDLIYLDAVSRTLRDKGEEGLNENWRILPAGGASNIPAFVSLMGQALNVTVLVDSGTEGAGRLESAIQAGRLDRDRLVSVSEITGKTHSDIEDLFTVEDYLTLYNAAFNKTRKAKDLGHGDRIVKRLADLDGVYDHYKPADALLRNPALLDALSAESLASFSKVIARINQTI